MSLTGSQLPATPITLHGPAMRLSNLVPLLADRAKVNLKLSPAVANDVVLVSVDNMPLDVLAAKIAELCLAGWIDSPTGPTLTRDQAKLNAAMAVELKLKLSAFQKAQTTLRNKLATEGEANPTQLIDEVKKHLASPDANSAGGYEKAQGFLRRMPIGEATRRIASIMPAADIEAIYRDQKVVFALNPNKLQRKLPREAQAILEKTWSDLNAYGAVLQGLPREEVENMRNGGITNYLYAFSQGPREMNGTWWVTGSSYGTSINFNLEYRGDIGALQGSEMVAAFFPAGSGLPSEDTTPLAFRPDSQALLNAILKADPQQQGEATLYVRDPADEKRTYPLHYTFRSKFPVVPDLAPGLLEKVLAPNENEPLGYWLSDALVQSAGSQKKDLIAWLGDSQFVGSLFALRAKPTVKGFLGNGGLWRDQQWTATDKLLTLRPLLQSEAIEDRGDRDRFAVAILSLAKNGFIPEDTFVSWAAHQRRSPSGAYEDFLIRLINPMGVDLNHMFEQWTGMGVYGCLTEQQRLLAKSGQALAYGGLSPDLKARLFRWTFQSNDPLYDMKNWRPDDPSDGARFAIMDPTFMFPDGMPAGASLRLAYRTTPAWLARYPGGKLAETETALSAASRMWVASKPVQTQSVSLPSPESFTEGEQRSFRIGFYVDPDWSKSNQFSLFASTGGQYHGFASLPAPYRQEVDRLLKIFENSGAGGNGGTPPPMEPGLKAPAP